MELYSKRKKAVENAPTAYRYDLPQTFKNQVIHIWANSIGFIDSDSRGPLTYGLSISNPPLDEIFSVYERINKLLCDEHGLIGLQGDGPCNVLSDWFVRADTDLALDIIEVSFRMIPIAQNNYNFMAWVRPQLNVQAAIDTINKRFQENAIGYRLDQGCIIRLDSEFLHSEATEPALKLMYSEGFEGSLEEFQLAHKHYRNGVEHYDDCLTNCGKSLESTLKTICDRRNWPYKMGDTASKLLEVVFSNGLIPNYLQTHFGGLRATLEGGVPTIRNREGGHGSGQRPNEVPEHLAAYQLHLTASAIVFLIRADEDFGKRKQ
ncbi:MAG: hypothetical protein WBE76_15205 [Terracidiphilus sp.]